MSTLDTLNTEALYVPGMRFWKKTFERRLGAIAQNANGAIEIWHALRDAEVGQVIGHSPKPLDGYELTMECTILGGTCYSKESFTAYSLDFFPLMQAGDDEAVLKQLAAWHDQVFAGTRVTAS